MSDAEIWQNTIIGFNVGIILLLYNLILEALSDMRSERRQKRRLATIINKGRKFIFDPCIEPSSYFTPEQIKENRYQLFMHKLNFSLENNASYISFDDLEPIYDALRHVQGDNAHQFKTPNGQYEFILKRLENIKWIKKRA